MIRAYHYHRLMGLNELKDGFEFHQVIGQKQVAEFEQNHELSISTK